MRRRLFQQRRENRARTKVNEIHATVVLDKLNQLNAGSKETHDVKSGNSGGGRIARARMMFLLQNKVYEQYESALKHQ